VEWRKNEEEKNSAKNAEWKKWVAQSVNGRRTRDRFYKLWHRRVRPQARGHIVRSVERRER